MIKQALFAVLLSGFVTVISLSVGTVNAQTTSPTSAPEVSPTTSTTMPDKAPSTGFGSN